MKLVRVIDKKKLDLLRQHPTDHGAFLLLQEVLSNASRAGYDLKGSVMKIDFSSSGWKVGIWLRPSLETQYSNGKYTAPFYCGSIKRDTYKQAVIDLLTAFLDETSTLS